MSTPSLSADQRDLIDRLFEAVPALDDLGGLFVAAGHELALVGGPVRDALLNRVGNDWDFATSANPDEVESLVSSWADALWDMGREFGTIGLRKGEAQFEITTYRSDTYDAESRKPDVEFGDSLVGDLS
ncbi:MAG: CCA tRNA nucleotidyltransferase, partial [Aeromicrobium sp.]